MARKKKGLIEAPVPIEGLPACDGKPVIGVITKFTGASQRIQRAIEIDERGFALVEWKSEGWDHKRGKDGIKRGQTLGVLEIYELLPDDVEAFVPKYRTLYKTDNGQRTIDDELADGAVTVDESGVAMTPTEEAEARGDQPPAPDLPPFIGYDELSEEEIVERIGAFDDSEVDQVDAIEAWEESHLERAHVLAAIKRWRDA